MTHVDTDPTPAHGIERPAPLPAPGQSHSSIRIEPGMNFATCAVMRLGAGCAVSQSNSFIQIDTVDHRGHRMVFSIDGEGVPTLIAALQQVHAEMTA